MKGTLLMLIHIKYEPEGECLWGTVPECVSSSAMTHVGHVHCVYITRPCVNLAHSSAFLGLCMHGTVSEVCMCDLSERILQYAAFSAKNLNFAI